MVFRHVYSIHALLKTYKPTCTPPVKVWRWPLYLSHVINVWCYQELRNMYYVKLCVKCQWLPSMGSWETVTGGLCTIFSHSTQDSRPYDGMCWYDKMNSNASRNFTNEVQILEKKMNLTFLQSTYSPLVNHAVNMCLLTKFEGGCSHSAVKLRESPGWKLQWLQH